MVQWVLTKCCEGIREGTLKYCMSVKFIVDSDNFEIIIHIHIKIHVMHDNSEHTTKLFVPLQGHALSHAIFCKIIEVKHQNILIFLRVFSIPFSKMQNFKNCRFTTWWHFAVQLLGYVIPSSPQTCLSKIKWHSHSLFLSTDSDSPFSLVFVLMRHVGGLSLELKFTRLY